jgi:putative RNA 2'-phosphotransferase
MSRKKDPKQLAGFIAYVLERRPDEFGLIPDPDGFIKIKEFLKALCEEEGWRYVRISHLNEIAISLRPSPVEIRDDRIRAVNREKLPQRMSTENVPKLLYAWVRKKAYPVVLEKGVSPGAKPYVVMSSDRKAAERFGARIDREPVILTVQTQKAKDRGVRFYQFGDTIFEAAHVPADCFTGPALPKQKIVVKTPEPRKPPAAPSLPGSFIIDITRGEKGGGSGRRRNKEADTGAAKGKKKLNKKRRERPPWRS